MCSLKVIVQRSKQAKVKVNTTEESVIGSIERGLVLLVGFTHQDSEQDVKYMAEKIINLRIFEDELGKMNYSVKEIGGQILSVSQFTLYGDCRKGRRPNFMSAANSEQAKHLYNLFNKTLHLHGVWVETGSFGAMMEVELINWGPVTLILES